MNRDQPVATGKLKTLRYMKAVALAALLGSALLYVVAIAGLARHAWLGYVAAFSGAAMVGALADWFAVVALFRHPLGIPFPHTAVIPNNQARIADSLGRFIHTRFLAPARVAELVAKLEPGVLVVAWLAQPPQMEALARQLGIVLKRTASATLAAAQQGPAIGALWTRVLARVDWAAAGARGLDALVAAGQERAALRTLLQWLQGALQTQRAPVLRFFAEHIQLPTTFQLDERAAVLLLKRVDQGLADLLVQLGEDPDHPLYAWCALELGRWARRLESDEALRADITRVQRAACAEPWLSAELERLWSGLVGRLDALPEAALGDILHPYLSAGWAWARREGALARWLDAQALQWVPVLVAQHGPAAGRFIASQMQGWDPKFLTDEIERHLGSDLQFIRLNGTLVGGLVGLLIHALTRALTHGGVGL